MYRRPFRRSAAPQGGFRRRRFGPRLRVAKEPQRWEVGHFFFGNIINITDAADSNATIVTSLAQIPNHIGRSDDEQGRMISNMTRWLEIGGIVFRYEIVSSVSEASGTNVPSAASELSDRTNWRVLLVSDRLDAVGSPVSIPNWFNVTTPVVAAASTTSEDLENEYPTRIHWQNFHGTTWANREGNGTGAVGPATFHVDNRRGGANLRLRLRLDDEHGLFVHFAQSSSFSDSDRTVVGSLLMTGTIYYRVRFG